MNPNGYCSRQISRRGFLLGSYLGLGGLALLDLLQAKSVSAADVSVAPLAMKAPHFPAKAKRCIFLFMEGGVSQMDLFEYKPALEKYAGQQAPKPEGVLGEIATFSAAPNRVIPSPFRLAWTRWPLFMGFKSTTTTTVRPFTTS
jgi:Protein of unknown function (DUF1501)